MRKTAFLLASVALAVLLVSGAAIAAVVACPNQPDGSCVGTQEPDTLNGTADGEALRGRGGEDTMRGLGGGGIS